MKAKTLLVAALIILGLSATALAQGTFQVGSIPVTTVVKTGDTEKAGDITFTLVPGSANTNPGTISIFYAGANITSGTPTTAANIIGGTGFTGATLPTINASSTVTPGLIIVNIPGGVAAGGTFTVTGIRLQISGAITAGPVNATLTTVGNAIVSGETSVTIINAVADGIASLTNDQVIKVNNLTGALSTNPSTLSIKEGALNSFGVGSGVRINLTSAPPTGLTFTVPATITIASSGTMWQIGNSNGTTTGGPTTTLSATNLSVYYYEVTTSATADQTVETLAVPVTAVWGTLTTPVAITTVAAQVSLAPFDSVTTTAIPRYTEKEVGPLTILSVSQNVTALLIPYATVGSGFDTGIAISNTTEDPGAAIMGTASAALKQSGTISFYFYPQGTATHPTTFVTSNFPLVGSGQDATGTVTFGSTYVVLLSSLLGAVSAPATFNGYIIAVTNFTNAHGIFVLSNFTTFGQSALMLALTDRTPATFPEIVRE